MNHSIEDREPADDLAQVRAAGIMLALISRPALPRLTWTVDPGGHVVGTRTAGPDTDVATDLGAWAAALDATVTATPHRCDGRITYRARIDLSGSGRVEPGAGPTPVTITGVGVQSAGSSAETATRRILIPHAAAVAVERGPGSLTIITRDDAGPVEIILEPAAAAALLAALPARRELPADLAHVEQLLCAAALDDPDQTTCVLPAGHAGRHIAPVGSMRTAAWDAHTAEVVPDPVDPAGDEPQPHPDWAQVGVAGRWERTVIDVPWAVEELDDTEISPTDDPGPGAYLYGPGEWTCGRRVALDLAAGLLAADRVIGAWAVAAAVAIGEQHTAGDH
ncbi:hypothetical protein B4N89_13630 [Embleya scabrispora]|uniref:Uncharacterized protein n=1 Tax=Embleya scabrispora TaxID=159449 RepID=A0A1T3NYD4_9ACTN|nr:hypothetical protein [Embleya scabrispora]OPC81838.1 hypothetical protein B4N89_13630 [Embleya scabrispora]